MGAGDGVRAGAIREVGSGGWSGFKFFADCADEDGMRNILFRFAGLGLLFPAAMSASGWEQLKPGMSRDEATTVLGSTALITSVGRGFEVAVYDQRGELVYLEGKLITWTAPLSSPAAPAPENTWQFNQVRTRPFPSVPAPVRLPAQRGSILPSYRL